MDFFSNLENDRVKKTFQVSAVRFKTDKKLKKIILVQQWQTFMFAPIHSLVFLENEELQQFIAMGALRCCYTSLYYIFSKYLICFP